ncbi:putative precoat protein [Pepper yellow leaf curl virus TDWS-21]|uniref:Protein V2 n=1 Tax=Pepper yellow leaf curl Indonesia virus TaxID=292477 RepID=A0A0U5BSN5_9GEMI|nr:putative precoat protein [Pepper yellow leaf curl virus TDWS-21]BAU21325.1 AV2 protein [Pepper yellow leaf curl Indonesia virus]BAU21331.1 AV2 protein [Pepper yellow leaf curl Indonesia virus]
MWDPLIHPFPETLHGFRCMLAIKYLQSLEATYSPDTVGGEFVRDLICLLRCKNYAEAFHRYSVVVANVYNTPETKLRESVQSPCCCPHCPRHVVQTKSMGKSAYESETQILQGSKEQ